MTMTEITSCYSSKIRVDLETGSSYVDIYFPMCVLSFTESGLRSLSLCLAHTWLELTKRAKARVDCKGSINIDLSPTSNVVFLTPKHTVFNVESRSYKVTFTRTTLYKLIRELRLAQWAMRVRTRLQKKKPFAERPMEA